MRHALLRTVPALLVVACSSPPPAPSELETLASWMTGEFASSAQAAADSNYLDVHLRAARIWTERTDGAWLYVEQSLATAPDDPYRQRVYRLRESDSVFESSVFEIPDARRYVGAASDTARFASLAPDSLIAREGCAVRLRRVAEGAFEGGTVGSDCTSALRGAVYATSEVRVTPDGTTSWDRGFDRDGVQVWGAATGPYRFDRIPPPAETGR